MSCEKGKDRLCDVQVYIVHVEALFTCVCRDTCVYYSV